jgi:DNA mismatch repair ATPase MutL
MYVFRSASDLSKLPGSQENYASAQFSEAKQRQERSDTHQGSEQSEHSISGGVGCSDSQTQSHFCREEQSRTNSNKSQLKQHHDGQNINEHQNSPFNSNNKDRLKSSNSFSEAQTVAGERKKKSVNERLRIGAQMERGGISPKVWCDLLLYHTKILYFNHLRIHFLSLRVSLIKAYFY